MPKTATAPPLGGEAANSKSFAGHFVSTNTYPHTSTGASPASPIVRLRLADISKISRAGLSEPSALLRMAAHHLRSLDGDWPFVANVVAWWERHAPSVPETELKAIIQEAKAEPRNWTADSAAWFLRLRWIDRQRLSVTTIGAIDKGKPAREKRRAENKRLLKERKRRAAGIPSRGSKQAAIVEICRQHGISRATAYRWIKSGKIISDSSRVLDDETVTAAPSFSGSTSTYQNESPVISLARMVVPSESHMLYGGKRYELCEREGVSYVVLERHPNGLDVIPLDDFMEWGGLAAMSLSELRLWFNQHVPDGMQNWIGFLAAIALFRHDYYGLPPSPAVAEEMSRSWRAH